MLTLPVHQLREANCLHCISLAILSFYPFILIPREQYHARYYGYPPVPLLSHLLVPSSDYFFCYWSCHRLVIPSDNNIPWFCSTVMRVGSMAGPNRCTQTACGLSHPNYSPSIISTSAMADVQAVLSALQVFNGAPDKASLEGANTWLQDFQHSVNHLSPWTKSRPTPLTLSQRALCPSLRHGRPAMSSSSHPMLQFQRNYSLLKPFVQRSVLLCLHRDFTGIDGDDGRSDHN